MFRANFPINQYGMKKILLVSIFAASFCFSGYAQSVSGKINPAGRVMLHDFKVERENALKQGLLNSVQGKPALVEPTVSAVVVLKEGCDPEKLFEGLDLEICSSMDGIVVVKCPITVCEQISGLPQVISVGFGDRLSPMLDFARPASSVQSVQNGFSYDGSTVSFDGTGVVCGMMDTGLEANHINFRNDDGSSRIKRLWHMNSSDGSSVEYTDATIKNFTTDNTSQGHATHVAGIIGGSYKGNGKYYSISSATGTSASLKDNQPIPYYGVATGADLAFAVGELYTPNIIQGVTNIIDYAESVGKPAVVNLSLGHTIGPHDGTDYYTQALSRLGKRGIICMSAGNDGDSQISITKTLSSVGNDSFLKTIPTYVNPNTGETMDGIVNGVVDIWTNGSEPITVGLYLFNGSASGTLIMETTTANQTISSGSYSNFTSNFDGSATMTSAVDPGNNRYNVYIEFNAVTMKSGNTSKYIMLQVSGAAGTKLYVYGSNTAFKKGVGSTTVLALTAGDAKESINDGCCGDNVISVGAYVTRTTWARLSGSVYGYTGSTYNVGQIAPFSSYGTTYQGKTLPLVSAPGANIISSYSSYYAGSSAATTMSASATSGNSTYYWGAMQGTSMSCPYVTGTIGLWLQADPSLTFDKVMDVINSSSTYIVKPALALPGTVYNGTAAEKVRWGAGSLNALEGVKYVLANKAAIGTVWADEAQRLVITASAEGYDVFVADGRDITVTLYDLQGRPAARVQGPDGAATLSADGLPHGVYIIEARGDGYRFSRKVTR